MAEAHAIARFVRVSPWKARRLVPLIRGKPVEEALAILQFTRLRAAGIVRKVVQSAAANAEHNHDLDRERLFVQAVRVNQGPAFRRLRPATRFPAIIRRPTSHITVVVSDTTPIRRSTRRGGRARKGRNR